MTVASGSGPLRQRKKVHPPIVGAQHRKVIALDIDLFPAPGQSAQLIEDQSADGVELLVAENAAPKYSLNSSMGVRALTTKLPSS